jgi:hypothetical protein
MSSRDSPYSSLQVPDWREYFGFGSSNKTSFHPGRKKTPGFTPDGFFNADIITESVNTHCQYSDSCRKA